VFNTVSGHIAINESGDNRRIGSSKSGKYSLCHANDNAFLINRYKTTKDVEVLKCGMYPAAPAGSTVWSACIGGTEKQVERGIADNIFVWQYLM